MQQQQNAKDVCCVDKVQRETKDVLPYWRTTSVAQSAERPWKRPEKQSTKSEEHTGDNLTKICCPSLNPTQRTFWRVVPLI
jgi:hypothetical protein